MADFDPSRGPNQSETLVEINRLKNLSDGVYAIALTLLVLDLRIPENVLAGDLSTTLITLAPKALVYLISFVIIGGAWGSHQRMIAQITRGDGLLVWFNLFSLLAVSIVPASAALLSRFPDAIIPLACFAVNALLIQLTAQWLWRHASRHGLATPTLDPRVVVSISRRLSLSAIVFGLSIPLALLSTTLVYLLWIGTFVLLFTTDWLSWQQAIQTQQANLPLEDARRAHVRVQHWGGHLNIGAHTGAHDLLKGVFGGGLDAKINRSEGEIDVHLNQGKMHGFMSLKFPWAWLPADLLDWSFSLNQHIPIVLDVVSANEQASLELGDLQVSELNLTSHGSSVQVSLPAHAGQTSIYIRASKLSLILRVPPDVGLRIMTSIGLTSPQFDLTRFTKTEQDGEYRSTNYDKAANRVDVRLEVAGDSVRIE